MQLAQLPMKRFLFVNVEKEPPFATSIVEVGEKLIEYGTEVSEPYTRRNTRGRKTTRLLDWVASCSRRKRLTRLDYLKTQGEKHVRFQGYDHKRCCLSASKTKQPIHL